MPGVTVKAGLASALGVEGRQAFEAHKADDTNYGQIELPPGINGIAQITDVKFDKFKQGDFVGKYFFFAQASIRAPIDFKDKQGTTHHIEGQYTRIGPEPLCPTPNRTRKTVKEHMAWVLNELRKLGADTKSINYDNLEATAKALTQSQPFIKFRTWQGEPTEEYPEPRVNHQWNGTCEFNDDSQPGDSVDDQSGAAAPAPSPNGQSRVAEKKAGPGTASATVEPEPEALDETTGDLDSLIEIAGRDDNDMDDGSAEKIQIEEARQRLNDMAIAAGYSEQEVGEAADWEAVREMINNPRTAPEESQAEPEKPAEPKTGDTGTYHPVDPKTKKPQKKGVDVEVMAVDRKTKTLKVQSLEDPKKKWEKVKFSDLLPAG